MLTEGHYHNIDTLRAANARAGRYFFSRDTMRFFKSRVSSNVRTVPGGWLFIISNKPPHGPRYYKVRKIDTRAHVIPESTPEYPTLPAARRALDARATKEKEVK